MAEQRDIQGVPLSGSIAVSVVIPSRNRSTLLKELLESLLVQDLDPSTFEIIVVDNCSKDDTAAMVTTFRDRAACRVIFHALTEDRGPCHARNVGANLASGAVIALTDSDCRARPDWLRRGLSGFDAQTAFVSGSVLNKPEQKLRLFSGSYPPVTSEHPTYPACNIFYRRTDFMALNGFDETLYFENFIDGKPIECADTDLAWRIKNGGGKNTFVAEATIFHEVASRKPLNWIVDPFRIFAIPALVKHHPQLRPLLLIGGIFFRAENILFYVSCVAALLGLFVHRRFFWGCLVYPCYIFWLMAKEGFSVQRIPKLVAQVALLSARQVFVSAGLVYGSIRFGSLVL